MPFDPSTIPVGPAPDSNPNAAAPPHGEADTKLTEFASAHTGVLGVSAPVLPPTSKDDPTPMKQADPYRIYTFGDGTQAVMNGAGDVQYYEPRTGNATAPYTEVKQAASKTNPGVDTFWGYNQKTGSYEEIPGAPKFDPNRDKVDIGQHPAQPTADGRIMVWDPNATNPKTFAKGSYVDSGAPVNAVAAQTASANLNELTARANLQNTQGALNQQQVDVLKAKTQPEIDELVKRGNLSQAQADQIYALLPGAPAAQAATTAKTNAETGLTQAQTDAVVGKTPAEIQQLVADGTLKQAQADQIKLAMQQSGATQASEIDLRSAQAANQRAQATAAGKPTVVNAPSDQMWITTQDNQGNIQTTLNKNYQPKDPAYAVMQLQTQQKAYADKLNADVTAGRISKDAAAQQWDDWNQQNVEPLKQGIQQAQQQLAFTNQTTNVATGATATNAAANAQNAATNNYNAQISAQKNASDIGTAAVAAANALPPGMARVGPGFGTEMNKVSQAFATNKAPGAIDWNSAMVSQQPDTSAIYQNAVANALKNISPMAAQITGAPMPTPPNPLDVNGLLNRSLGSYDTTGVTQAASAGGGTGGTGTPAFQPSASATAAAAGPSPGPYQPDQALTSGPTAATAPTQPTTLMNPGDPNYVAWLQANMPKYQLAA